MTLPSCGGMVLAAHQRLNYKASAERTMKTWHLRCSRSSNEVNGNVSTGALYPTSMRINGQGRLVVNFRTEARFRGLFVFAHPGRGVERNFFSFRLPDGVVVYKSCCLCLTPKVTSLSTSFTSFIHGHVSGSSGIDLQSKPCANWADVQPAHPAVDFCVGLFCKYIWEKNKFTLLTIIIYCYFSIIIYFKTCRAIYGI